MKMALPLWGDKLWGGQYPCPPHSWGLPCTHPPRSREAVVQKPGQERKVAWGETWGGGRRMGFRGAAGSADGWEVGAQGAGIT